jgi:hypothetical protein
VVTPSPAQWVPDGGRHGAARFACADAVAADPDLTPRDEHTESDWSRQMFDSLRDADPFDWLGFTDARQ